MTGADRASAGEGFSSSRSDAGIFARVALRAIRDYQLVNAGRPRVCAYDETCSSYAVRQILNRGLMRGGWAAFRRFRTCTVEASR
jgi:putative component of membrane protein insertase Oxa1/YidC/SpoIIIJ protein YidD